MKINEAAIPSVNVQLFIRFTRYVSILELGTGEEINLNIYSMQIDGI